MADKEKIGTEFQARGELEWFWAMSLRAHVARRDSAHEALCEPS